MVPKVEELMSRKVYEIDGAKSVQKGAEEMARLGIGSLLVTHDGAYVGMITEVDIIRKVVAEKRRPTDVRINEVMTSPLITIKSDQSIIEGNGLMEAKNKRHLAVTQSGKVVGVVSVRDFLRPLYMKEDADKVIKQSGGFNYSGN